VEREEEGGAAVGRCMRLNLSFLLLSCCSCLDLSVRLLDIQHSLIMTRCVSERAGGTSFYCQSVISSLERELASEPRRGLFGQFRKHTYIYISISI
jgi:hypothetical protein